MTGKVARLFRNKQFGFINAQGADYFFHRDDFSGHWNDLADDFDSNKEIEVEFKQVLGSKKGPRAQNVTRLDYPNQSVG